MLKWGGQNVAQLLKEASVCCIHGGPFWDDCVFKQIIQGWHIPFSGFLCNAAGEQVFESHHWFKLVDNGLGEMIPMRKTSDEQAWKNKKLWEYFHFSWF